MINLAREFVLIKKEWIERKRNPSIFLVSWILPIFLLLMFGFGLSMDLDKVKIGIVLEENSAISHSISQSFTGSRYFLPSVCPNLTLCQNALKKHEIEAIVIIPNDFSKKLSQHKAEIGAQIIGTDAPSAMIIRTYIKALTLSLAHNPTISKSLSTNSTTSLPVQINSRYLFNEANNSQWYLVPGMLIIITTLVASFCASLTVAREYERGTIFALTLTPSSPIEWLLAKWIVDISLVSIGILIMLGIAFWVFEVPLKGSFLFLFLNLVLYAAWATSAGLFISAATKRQFLAIQMSLIVSYLPALLLSGFLFDLRSVPEFIRFVGYLMPPTYAIESIKIHFLSGGISSSLIATLIKNAVILSLWTIGFMTLASYILRKER